MFQMEEQVEMLGYYHLFDTNRASLASLYQPSSMLTFEGQKIVGTDGIRDKLEGLPFEHCKHQVSTVDSQAAAAKGGIVVFVSGSLQLAGEERPLRFSQMFHLLPTVQGTFFVHNDIFRLNYG